MVSGASARKQAHSDNGVDSAPAKNLSAVHAAPPVHPPVHRVYRSEGQRLFTDVPGSLSAIAAVVGVSKSAVRWWRNGDKIPADHFRAKIHESYGIAPHEWDRAAQGQPAAIVQALEQPREQREQPREPKPVRSTEGYADLIEVCQDLLQSGQLKATDKLKAVAEVRALRAQLDRQERHAKKTVTDREVVRSVAWAKIRDALGAALKPHPQALVCVVEFLKKLDT